MREGAVAAIINFRGKILLGRKRSDSKKVLAGKWHLPGGNVGLGESDEVTLIREMREELGILIKVNRYIASSITPTSGKELRWYECFCFTDRISLGDDLEDAKFVQRNEVLGTCGEEVYSRWPEEVHKYFR